MAFANNYFVSSFFWNFLSKILNAVFGFASVPILLGYFGKADYGILSIATACNSYMHVMDLGINTGAIKFFAQWNAEGKRDLIQKVSNTNTTFYLLISCVNVLGLLALAWFGESFFSVNHEQFLKLQSCFYVLALFSSISWATSAYSQLLTAYKKIVFTMKVNCLMVVLRLALIVIVLIFGLSLIEYFFYLTALVTLTIVPYVIKCKREKILDSLKPAMYWKEFGIVFSFSLSIFAMSLFQTTAIQSRPIILSIFAENGAETVGDYRIIEVFPLFIVMLCGAFTGIFLPQSSEMLVKNCKDEIQIFVESWTTKTTILVCVLCFPIIVAAKDLLSAYVGDNYGYLGIWLQLWCVILVFQMHSTPAFSFVLAKGKTKVLVVTIALATIISMIVNVSLCKTFPIGSAIIGYVVYVILQVIVDYAYMYRCCINLNSLSILKSFVKPLSVGLVACVFPIFLSLGQINLFPIERLNFIMEFVVKSFLWFLPYVCMLFTFRILRFSDVKKIFSKSK